VGSSSTRLGAITASSAGRYCHRNGGHRVHEMDISRPCERIDPPRSVYTSRISSCPGSKPGLVSVPGGSSIALRARCQLYRPPEEAISSSPGNLRQPNIVLSGKLYRSPWEVLSSCPGTNHVRRGKVYRPLWEGISSPPGKLIVLPGKKRSSFACKSAVLWLRPDYTLCICFC
jgi:hypothetical protein